MSFWLVSFTPISCPQTWKNKLISMVVKYGTKINAIHGCQEDVNRDCPTVNCYLIRVVVDYKDLR